MCGIHGIINHSGSYIMKGEILVKQLFWGSALRGTDAYGMALINLKGELDWYKHAGVSLNTFFNESEEGRPRFLEMEKDKAFIICHNRFATVGDKDALDHAHPHITANDELALVHNGTLQYWKQPMPGETDSQGLARIIAEEGLEVGIREVRGAFAIVYYDTLLQELNIVRNNDRPLGIVETPEFSVFASEPEMAAWVLSRNDIKITDFTEIKPGKWYRWGIKDKNPIVKDIDITPKIHSYYYPSRRHPYADWEGYGGNTYGKAPTTTVTELHNPRKKSHVILGSNSTVKSYQGYQHGDEIEFQLDGYKADERTAFCSVWGTLLGDESRGAMVRGNIAMSTTELDKLKTYLVGKISSMTFRRGDEIFIQVKDVKPSKSIDTNKESLDDEELSPGKVVAALPAPFIPRTVKDEDYQRCAECQTVVRKDSMHKVSDWVQDPQNIAKMKRIELEICSACHDSFMHVKHSMC